MKKTFLVLAFATLVAAPAFAGQRGSNASLLGNVNVTALNNVSVLSGIASGNRVNAPVASGNNVVGNTTKVGATVNAVTAPVTGVVKGLLGGGLLGCGCN